MNKNVRIIEVLKDVTKEAASAERLFEIRSIIKELEKEEKQLKQTFLDMGAQQFDSGDYLVSVVSRERESLDKKSLVAELGDRIKNFTNLTAYKVVSVSRK